MTLTDLKAGRVDLTKINRDRVAVQCVCCGSFQLQSSPAVLMPFVAHRTFGWQPVTIDESWGLRTIENGHAYSICKSMYCEECGFVFLDIRFTDAELDNLYRDYRGEEYSRLRESYEPGYNARNDSLVCGIDYIDKIEAFLKPHLASPLTVLDWGGDTGRNTPFRGAGRTVDVYDISSKAAEEGARIVGKDEALSKTYSLIVCSNVLEHVPYPADLLLEIKQAMGAETVLYLEVPFEEVMQSKTAQLPAAKKHWHEHINFYSERSLHKLLGNCGLSVIAADRVETEIGGRSACLFQLACKLDAQ